MQNIEFKAELRDIESARAQCELLGASRIGVMRQTDTYFRMPDGRLKKREAPDEPIEWIFYHRTDQARPRLSNYTIISDEQARRRWGTANLRPWITVIKKRELWMLDNVRIHLDEVDKLGRFIEFEALVSKTSSIGACHQKIAHLREAFTTLMGEPLSASYCDLMAQEIEPEAKKPKS